MLLFWPFLMASLILAIFCKPLRRFEKWHCPIPRQERCLPPLLGHGSTGLQEWSCEDTSWRGLGIFPLEKQNRTHPQVFFPVWRKFLSSFSICHNTQMSPSSLYLCQAVPEGHVPLTVITRSLYPAWADPGAFTQIFLLFHSKYLL